MTEKMENNKKKNGEKSLILEMCWKLLSDSDEKSVGGVKVTQGIYCKIDGTKTEVFCKRGVFVPESFCFEKLQNIFAEFGAKLNPCVSRKSTLGLCGVFPTRTAHADDTEFFLLAQIHEKFVVIAIVSTDEANNAIEKIQSDTSSISDAVKSVKDEAAKHLEAKEKHKKKNEPSSASKTVDTCEVTSKSVGIQRPREEDNSLEPSPKKTGYNEYQQCDSAENDATPRSSSTEIANSLCMSEYEEQCLSSLFQLDNCEDQIGSVFPLNTPLPFYSGYLSDSTIPIGFDSN